MSLIFLRPAITMAAYSFLFLQVSICRCQQVSKKKKADILFGRGHIRGLRKEIGEEGVADEGIFVSLMRPFGHGVGKERDVHIVAGCVFPRIGESHDPVQISVYALFIAGLVLRVHKSA